jgi:hypothetical protein
LRARGTITAVDNEILAITLTFFVHVLGVGALIWHLLSQDDERPDWRGWFRPDDDTEPPAEPSPSPSRGGLPLPDAAPSMVRLREPGLLADAHGRPPRRPAHAPERTPERVPSASVGDG